MRQGPIRTPTVGHNSPNIITITIIVGGGGTITIITITITITIIATITTTTEVALLCFRFCLGGAEKMTIRAVKNGVGF